MNSLQQRLHDYIDNPDDSDANFNLAQEYERIGQTGAALAWYLRSAEKAHDDLKQYECLLHCALCLERQKTRDDSTKVLLLKAVALLPQRPEAYFLLARLHERGKIWQDSYTVAVLGLTYADFTLPPLSTDVEYPGRYGLLFERGVAAWWIAFCDESRQIMADLKANYEMIPLYANAVDRNLATCGYP